MSSIDIVIADALVPADFVADLLRDMALPALDMVAAQGSDCELRIPYDDLLPGWQAWPFRTQSCPNVALGWSRHFNSASNAPLLRYLLEPVHFEVGSHGLVLHDPAQLDLSEGESAALRRALAPGLEPAGVHVAGGDATRWLIDVDVALQVSAAVTELALHQDMLPFLPQGQGERAWRKLSTAAQMELHQHSANEERERRGAALVSGLWLSGTGSIDIPAALPYRQIAGMPPWLQAWWLDASSSAELIGISALAAPRTDQDWSGFRNLLTGIDLALMQHLNALRAGEIAALRVVLTAGAQAREVVLRRSDLYKFWRRGRAAELFDLPE